MGVILRHVHVSKIHFNWQNMVEREIYYFNVGNFIEMTMATLKIDNIFLNIMVFVCLFF